MLEIFLPLPIDIQGRIRVIKRRQSKTPSTLEGVNYSGKFVSVKDYEYVRVAKMIGETQVGINLFYLVDSSTIVGYRNASGYYLRSGSKKRQLCKKIGKK